ncbi:hypothetical protein SNEBB_003404 [Seison nebaliae]|nr:hypothetical protein SNEBB_003404 [Seison nebaliae]
MGNILSDNLGDKISEAAMTDDAVKLQGFLADLPPTEIDKQVDPHGSNALFICVTHNAENCVQFLLKNGADPNIGNLKNGYTPLYAAATFIDPTNSGRNSLEVLNILVNDKRVNLNQAVTTAFRNKTSRTEDMNPQLSLSSQVPLMGSIRIGKTNFQHAITLIEAGADVNYAEETTKETPLVLACYYSSRELIEALLKKNADAKHITTGGYTTLQWLAAGVNDDPALVDILAEYDLQIDHKNDQGRTALMIASYVNKPKTVEKLLALGADFSLTDRFMKTAYDYVASDPSKYNQVIQILQRYISA